MTINIGRSLLAPIVVLSLITSSAPGQQNLKGWNKVKKEIGSEGSVITKKGQRLNGKLIEATDDLLKIEDKGQTSEIIKIDIAEVRVRKITESNKPAWVCALGAAGFVIGAVIGKAAETSNEDPGMAPLLVGIIGAGAGAATGAVISNRRNNKVKEERIYKAP
jgi:hypothetical protein